MLSTTWDITRGAEMDMGAEIDPFISSSNLYNEQFDPLRNLALAI